MKTEQTIFEVDETSDLPIWVQLRNRITYLVRTGFFKAGEQLPSVRSLAAEANINYNTVTKAYRDLELSGLIVSIRGRGMYVQNNLPDYSQPSTELVDRALEDCIERYRNLGMTFDEIDAHLRSVTEALRAEARSAKERITGYDIE
ncbi:GntR family transcriptional regulator [Eggerthella sinensis]|uniref:GntR family transcriptional regulator n=1 Tax=Eggerthella sinensis TaxID=242230 RepID=UPI0022E2294B|nr:GntR family transcriptional regulator [Eggerthella sinensis]